MSYKTCQVAHSDTRQARLEMRHLTGLVIPRGCNYPPFALHIQSRAMEAFADRVMSAEASIPMHKLASGMEALAD
jgi:hypothetical protein